MPKYKVKPGNNDQVFLVVTDVRGNKHELFVNQEDLALYEQGAHVQDAFPYLSANERELLISGIPGDMWDDIFKEEE